MLNLFASAGHMHHAKCARLYLQMMLKLPDIHPTLHDLFTNSKMHTVRRTNRFWAGLSTDLAIEQVMMRSVKSRGGLTHGRGLSETVRVMWVQSMHSCAEVHSAMTRLTNMETCSEETVHTELEASCMKRDTDDLTKVLEWFNEHNPFIIGEGTLHNLVSGITASENDDINCDDAESVGQMIMQLFDNSPYSEVVLRKADGAVLLSALVKKMTVSRKQTQIDPNVLFTRLLFILQRPDSNDDHEKTSRKMEAYFACELTPLPCALFNDGCMRKTNKSLLAHHLRGLADTIKTPAQTESWVIDGGYLLHKVKWKPGSTFGHVIEQYALYVQQHFANDVTVVFDGYESRPSIKDHEHLRRARKSSPVFNFDDTTNIYSDQESFLANKAISATSFNC